MRGIARHILHLAGAFLLAFAIVSPVVAEVGCSAEAAAHVADGDAATEADHAFVDGDPHDQDQTPERDDHCAFSHGHCGGLSPVVFADTPVAAPAPLTHAASQQAFRTRDPAGPDRPPRS